MRGAGRESALTCCCAATKGHAQSRARKGRLPGSLLHCWQETGLAPTLKGERDGGDQINDRSIGESRN